MYILLKYLNRQIMGMTDIFKMVHEVLLSSVSLERIQAEVFYYGQLNLTHVHLHVHVYVIMSGDSVISLDGTSE